jgi:hypothetical protein
MRIRQCIGLSKECTEFSTSETQLCEKHEKELKEKVKAAGDHERKEQ